MFGFGKRKKLEQRFSEPLSPEADKFLAEALEEYGQKEEALEQGWRLSTCKDYDLDMETGTMRARLEDGTAWEADAQILGSFNEDDSIWAWAWGNPQCAEVWKRDSKAVREVGRQLGIWYLHELEGHPMPGPEFVAYLCAIGIKASNSAGMYEVRDGSIVIFVMLKNLRWTTGEGQSAAASVPAQSGGDSLAATIRQIKAGREDLLPGWLQQFAQADVYVISRDQAYVSDPMVIGPEGDKNYIVVFTELAELQNSLGQEETGVYPVTLKGKELLEYARDNNRGICVNPNDDSATLPLPHQMMAPFLEGLDKLS